MRAAASIDRGAFVNINDVEFSDNAGSSSSSRVFKCIELPLLFAPANMKLGKCSSCNNCGLTLCTGVQQAVFFKNHVKPSENAFRSFLLAQSSAANIPLVTCPFGCPQLYCSSSCQRQDVTVNGHEIYCLGSSKHSSSVSHSLTRICKEIGNTHALFAYQVLCRILTTSAGLIQHLSTVNYGGDDDDYDKSCLGVFRSNLAIEFGDLFRQFPVHDDCYKKLIQVMLIILSGHLSIH
jgi:hypothetical protein